MENLEVANWLGEQYTDGETETDQIIDVIMFGLIKAWEHDEAFDRDLFVDACHGLM